MTAPVPVTAETARPLLAAVARLLAARGAAGVPDVLALTRSALDCRHLVLRGTDASAVLARVDAPAEVPVQRPVGLSVVDAPVRTDGGVRAVLTATATRPFDAAEAALVAAVADLLAVALSERPSPAAAMRAVLDAEADRTQAASALQETVDRALATVRYAAEQVAAGRATRHDLDEALRAAIAAARNARSDLRPYALEAGLRVAMSEIGRRGGGDRLDDGVPALRVHVDAADPRLDRIPPALALTVQRVAEAALRGATGQADVSVGYDGSRVKLVVNSAETSYDASELDRWARRVNALGGDLRLRPDGVELELPTGSS